MSIHKAHSAIVYNELATVKSIERLKFSLTTNTCWFALPKFSSWLIPESYRSHCEYFCYC